jgi:hypothetical protein
MWRGRPRPRTANSKPARSWNNLLCGFCLLLALLTPCLAQRGGAAGGHSSGLGHAPSHLSGRSSAFLRGADFRRSLYSPYSSLPFPFFGDAFDPGDLYSTGYPVASQPPPYVLQAASQMAASGASFMPSNQSDARPPSQPLLIELQNGRYVSVSTTPIDGEARDLTAPQNPPPPASARNFNRLMAANSAAPEIAPSSPPPPLPPVTLFFRDGHSEEVRDYTIANGILYAAGDYYTDGYWNKKIDLSTVDLTRTLQANAARDVKFILPASPNEVITRP